MKNQYMSSLLVLASFIVGAPQALACHGHGCGDGYQAQVAAECVQAIVDAGCNIDFGDRAAICERTVNGYSVQAIRRAFERSCNISDSTLSNLVRVNGPNTLGCVTSITSNGCNIDFGDRASICLRTRSSEAVQAMDAAFERSCNIADSTLSNLAHISNGYQLGCVTSITSNGCNIDFGDRAAICQDFCSTSGVRAADAAFSRSCNVSDSTLSAFAKMKGY